MEHTFSQACGSGLTHICAPFLAQKFALKSPWPNPYTAAALVVILMGAVAYVSFDSEFNLRSYSWATAYVCAMTTDMVLIKKIVNEVCTNLIAFWHARFRSREWHYIFS